MYGDTPYVVPRYRAAEGTPWHHVLHGNVPDHQIDFIYCPEVPQGLLTPTHFSHLARLLKYIEPQAGATHAFAIGNLSRDDTQHEAGHGALGMMFGFRIGGATDHAGRVNPPFAHGIIAVDRDLRHAPLLETASTFYRHVVNASEVDSSPGLFYREYMRAVQESPERVAEVLARYVERFGDLPEPGRSALGWAWEADEPALPRRVVLVHGDDEPFGAIAHVAAKVAAMLYQSNIRWTAITNGREADIPGGVTVRLVAERNLTMEDRHGVLMRLDEVPHDESEIARVLFGAKPRRVKEEERPRYAGWRERYTRQAAGEAGVAAATPDVARAVPPRVAARSERSREEGEAPGAERASEPPASQRGPQGTLVMDREKLFGAAVREPPSTAMGTMPGPKRPCPARTGALGGAEQEEILVTVDMPKPAPSKIWLVVGAGCVAAMAVGVAVVAASSDTPSPVPAPARRGLEVAAQERPVAIEPPADVVAIPGPEPRKPEPDTTASLPRKPLQTFRNGARQPSKPESSRTTEVTRPEKTLPVKGLD